MQQCFYSDLLIYCNEKQQQQQYQEQTIQENTRESFVGREMSCTSEKQRRMHEVTIIKPIHRHLGTVFII